MAFTRVVAACLLLLYGSTFGAATVFDAISAARSNGAAHIEDDAGPECFAHDESTCQLCRVSATAGCTTAGHVKVVAQSREEHPIAAAYVALSSAARTSLHSRAPPAA